MNGNADYLELAFLSYSESEGAALAFGLARLGNAFCIVVRGMKADCMAHPSIDSHQAAEFLETQVDYTLAPAVRSLPNCYAIAGFAIEGPAGAKSGVRRHCTNQLGYNFARF